MTDDFAIPSCKAFLGDEIVQSGWIDIFEYFIRRPVYHDTFYRAGGKHGLNGYVLYPKDWHVDSRQIECVGGITFHREFREGMLIGFDTLGYDENEFNDPDWAMEQCEQIARQIMEQWIAKTQEVKNAQF